MFRDQGQRSKFTVTEMEMFVFRLRMHVAVTYRGILWMHVTKWRLLLFADVGVLYAKIVGATSSEGFPGERWDRCLTHLIAGNSTRRLVLCKRICRISLNLTPVRAADRSISRVLQQLMYRRKIWKPRALERRVMQLLIGHDQSRLDWQWNRSTVEKCYTGAGRSH